MDWNRPFTSRGESIPQVRLSLASPVFTVVRGIQAGLAVLLVGSILFTLWCWWESQSLEATAARYAQALTRVQNQNREFADRMKTDGLTLTSAQIAAVHRKVTFMNRLMEKQAFSWTRLLSDLERVLPRRVSISSVRLDFKTSTVRLQGSVMTLRDLDTMVDRLEEHGAFDGVKVSNHQFAELKERPSKRGVAKTRKGRSGKPRSRQVVKFELTVRYATSASET